MKDSYSEWKEKMEELSPLDERKIAFDYLRDVSDKMDSFRKRDIKGGHVFFGRITYCGQDYTSDSIYDECELCTIGLFGSNRNIALDDGIDFKNDGWYSPCVEGDIVLWLESMGQNDSESFVKVEEISVLGKELAEGVFQAVEHSMEKTESKDLNEVFAQIEKKYKDNRKRKKNMKEEISNLEELAHNLEKRIVSMQEQFEKDFSSAEASNNAAGNLVDSFRQKINTMQEMIYEMWAMNDGLNLELGWLNGLEELIRRRKENDKEENDKIPPHTLKKSFDEIVDYVWRDLWFRQKLEYDKAIIRQFMNALTSDELILLWGRPGTGKTSLSEAVAKAVGGKCKTISVQPNWTDNQDLLGYYNTIDMRYSPTVFLDALVEAREHREQLYILVLDEMNLAHVEYYFSEVLSNLSSGKKAELNLYSSSFKEDWEKRADMLLSAGEPSDKNGRDAYIDELKKIAKKKEEMEKYPPVFEIPSNVRFVGTLNMDGTTKDISPKVRDRSYLIEIGERWEEQPQPSGENVPEELLIHADYFKPYRKVEKPKIRDKKALEDMKNLEESIKDHAVLALPEEISNSKTDSKDIAEYLFAFMSMRYKMQETQLLWGYHIDSLSKEGIQKYKETENIAWDEISDDILLCKVIPCVELRNVSHSGGDTDDDIPKESKAFLHALDLCESEDFQEKYRRSAKKLKQMIDYAKRNGSGSYWSLED